MKIKALFLLFTFLLNTAVGLNCALRSCSDDCKDEIAEHHQGSSVHPQQEQQSLTTAEKKDACCQEAVNSFVSLAKLIPHAVKISIPVSVARSHSNYQYALKPVPDVGSGHPLFLGQRLRPPTHGIRIRIQSFQI